MSTRSLLASVLSVIVAGAAACSADPDGPAGEEPVAPEDRPDAEAGAVDAAAGDGGVSPAGDAAPAKIPCPAGMPARWTCDASKSQRVRCIDGFVQAFACTSGCVAGTAGSAQDEATCSCGASTTFSHWNCGTGGDLHTCAGGGAWHDRSCGGLGCEAAPAGISDTCKLPAGSSLQSVIVALGAKCGVASPGATCGIAVRDLVTGEYARYRGTTPYVSASSAKAIWVAAALYDRSVADVQPHAARIFEVSDNTASGKVIDLLASPDRVSTFMWQDIGIPDSAFCSWNFDKKRESSNCPRLTYGFTNNFFTADDMVSFMTVLWDRSLLGDAKSQALLEWMTLSPRTGYGGWMGTRIPAAARAGMHHKAGWLPPDAVPGMAIANEMGILEVPGGHAYAVALLTEGNRDGGSVGVYNGMQLPMLEKASCVVYHAVARDVADPFSACEL